MSDSLNCCLKITLGPGFQVPTPYHCQFALIATQCHCDAMCMHNTLSRNLSRKVTISLQKLTRVLVLLSVCTVTSERVLKYHWSNAVFLWFSLWLEYLMFLVKKEIVRYFLQLPLQAVWGFLTASIRWSVDDLRKSITNLQCNIDCSIRWKSCYKNIRLHALCADLPSLDQWLYSLHEVMSRHEVMGTSAERLLGTFTLIKWW